MNAQTVSGRYRGATAGLEVELRVDVDGSHPLNVVSADYSRTSGSQPRYLGSMRLDAPRIVRGPRLLTITGTARFTFGASHRKVTITIPRDGAGRPPATLRHPLDRRRTLRSACEFEGVHFRHVEFEEARERGVQRPPAHDTAAFTTRARPRTLLPVDAYAEAGIELAETGPTQVIETSGAGPDAAWSDAELHAAMEQHFTALGDGPKWAIWLMHAGNHTDPTISGLMFDRRGPQRQGCAVFHGYEPADTADQRRGRLYSCVHELGHVFNLRHCWQRSLYEPPVPSRPHALSWMNYPDRFEGGPDAFFGAFGFGFDDAELGHLRHGFRQDVIMGGAPFGGTEKTTRGPARGRDDGWAPERQDPALRLRLSAPAVLALNVPVSVGLELSTTAQRGRLVPTRLGPRSSTVDVIIRRPDGEETLFEPLLEHCRAAPSTELRPGAALRDSAFVHYGKHGYTFAEPGTYRLQSRYTAPDGRIALSNVVIVRVRPATTRADRRVDALIAGNEQVGTLMSLLGSRADTLDAGNDTLRTLIETVPSHPVADVARVLRGVALARDFKHVDARGAVVTRSASLGEASTLIGPIAGLAAARPAATPARRAAAHSRGPVTHERAFSAALTNLEARAAAAPAATGLLRSRPGELAALQAHLAPAARPGRRSGPSVRTRTRPINQQQR